MRQVLALAILLSFGTGLSASADDRLPLLIDIESSSLVSRTCGPIPLDLRVDWAGNGILEGKLILEVVDQGRDRLATLVVDDFFVSPGEQHVALLMPSLPTTWSEQVSVEVVLVTEDRTWELGTLILRVPGSSKRTMVVCTGMPESMLHGRGSREIARWLSLEDLQPTLPTYRRNKRGPITTLFSEMAVETFPQNPHWHCAHDVVLLTADGFGRLEPAQIEALLAWVRAGGSLVVFLGGERLSPAQAEALNQLAGVRKAGELRILTSRSGEILWDAMQDDFSRPKPFHYGLGRAVLARLDGGTRSAKDDPAWRDAALFLWKLRHDQVAAVRKTGTWTLEIGQNAALAGLDYYQRANTASNDLFAAQAAMAADFQPRPIGGGTGLVEKLLPQGLRLIPLWLIAVVLVCYIVAIGPLDYLLLGALRMRKWTWVLFPLTTLAFLGFAVVLSNSYLKRGDHRGIVVFRDVVDGGLIARENELQLLFSGAARKSVTEVQNSLFAPLQFQEFGTGNAWQLQRMRGEHDLAPTILEGRMPANAKAVQALTQWSPQLNRLTRIPRSARVDDSGFDWNAPIDPLSESGRSELIQRIVATFGYGVVAQAFLSNETANRQRPTSSERIFVSGNEIYNSNAVSDSPNSGYSRVMLVGDDRIFDSNYDQSYIAVPAPGGGYRNQLVKSDFVQQCSVREQTGLFSLVAQVSPMGGHRFEDMALLDPSDPDDVLLVIAKREGSKWTVYRRLYRNNGE